MKKFKLIALTASMLSTVVMADNQCVGTTDAPASIKSNLIDRTQTDEGVSIIGQSVKGEEKGDLCEAKVYEVKSQPIRVYRIWDSNYIGGAKGTWWTLDRPSGKIENIRNNIELCREYNGTEKLEVCDLKPGGFMALGPGQSTMCEGSGYPYKYSKSSTQQVYIPSNYKQDLTHCHVESAVISWEKDDTPNYRFQFPTDHEDITADVCGKIMTLKKGDPNVSMPVTIPKSGVCRVDVQLNAEGTEEVKFTIGANKTKTDCTAEGINCDQVVNNFDQNVFNFPK